MTHLPQEGFALKFQLFLTRVILFKLKKKKVLASLLTPGFELPCMNQRKGEESASQIHGQQKRSRSGERGRKRKPTDASTQISHTAHGPALSYGKDKVLFFQFATAPTGRFPAWLIQLRNVPC